MNKGSRIRPGWRHRSKQGIPSVLLLLALSAVVSCQGFRPADAGPALFGLEHRPVIQEGEVTLQDGDETRISYPRPYDSAPRLVIVEFKQSQFVEKPYSKKDFEILKQEATYFKIRNNHAEQGRGSWATVKWRAEGILSAKQPTGTGLSAIPAGLDNETTNDQIIAAVKRMGGKTKLDSGLPKSPIVGIDLHQTRTTDGDVTALRTLKNLHELNLYGTGVTDAGLATIGRLVSLQSLYLNDTAVTDAGVQLLQGLTNLGDLGLSQTRVTDEGLRYLKSLTNLHDLALSGPLITDAGLVYLKDVKNLKHLILNHTQVTANGVQELRKALPRVQVTFLSKY